MLTLSNRWRAEARSFVRWSPQSQMLLRRAKAELGSQFQRHLSSRCAHLKGHGGVKGAVRRALRLTAWGNACTPAVNCNPPGKAWTAC